MTDTKFLATSAIANFKTYGDKGLIPFITDERNRDICSELFPGDDIDAKMTHIYVLILWGYWLAMHDYNIELKKLRLEIEKER